MSKKNNDENLISTAVENAAAALENAASSIVTDYIKENVEYRASSGLKETIIREELASCCKWCHALAGEYEYGLEPSDIYRRHDNCKCIVLFKSAKGKYQEVWSKKQYSSKAEAKTEARKQVTKPAEKKKKAEKRIAQEQASEERKAKRVDWEYRRTASPGQGKIQGAGNKESAEWLLEKYGGNIELVDDESIIWNGDKWKLETPVTADGIETIDIKGNAIVDLRNIPVDGHTEALGLAELLDKLDKQLKRSNRDVDAIVRYKQNGQDITAILRYKK